MDIKSEILDYINCNETTGALLLTGPWGCGKSFLVKQIAQDLNKEKKAAVTVISLFGLESIAAINKRVKDEYINLDMGSVGKAVNKFSKGFTTLLKDGLSVAATATAAVPSPTTTGLSAASQGLSALMSYDVFSLVEIKNKVGKDDNMRKFVIVFDDLERCGIYSKKDLLGAINEFVENKQIKVIVIADEEKINGEEYREYKEKLISRTVRMSVDYNLLIEQLVKDYNAVNVGYTEFLAKSMDLLKQVFFESNTSNVRMLKCIMADFERVYAAWTECKMPTENMPWVLYTFAAMYYISKAKTLESETKESTTDFSKKEEQYSSKGKNKSAFVSINNWIQYGQWDKNSFVRELKQRYAEQEETPFKRFIKYKLFELEQNDIEVGLPQAVELAYDGKLSKGQLISLIAKIHYLNKKGIELPCHISYQQMEEGIEKRIAGIRGGTVTEEPSRTFIGRDGVDEDAFALLQKIERFEDRVEAAENRTKYLQYLNGDESIQMYSLKGMPIESFDLELRQIFWDKYDTAQNLKKLEFAHTLLRLVFDNTSYSTSDDMACSKKNFEKLIECLDSMQGSDTIAKLNSQEFIEEILKLPIMCKE